MRYLLDTNIFIHARDGHRDVRNRLVQHQRDLLLSALSLAELQRGLDPRESDAALRLSRNDLLLPLMTILPFDAAVAEAYGKIVWYRGRTKSRDIDHMIAAHAISAGAILVTDSTSDFAGIPGLALENWATA